MTTANTKMYAFYMRGTTKSCSGSENGTKIRKTTPSALLDSILIDTQ